jgi:Glycosyl transferase family 2
LTNVPKLRLERPVSWDHHRGGWRSVVGLLTDHLHVPDGIRLITAVEETIFSGEVIGEPWVGFVHEVPHHSRAFPDLERLLAIDTWKASVTRCRGLWTLTQYQKRYLQSCGLPFPVASVYYPTEQPQQPFSFKRFLSSNHRKLLFIGEYLRLYDPFYELLASGYQKVLLRCFPTLLPRVAASQGDPVEIMDYVDAAAYDNLLEEGIVFLALSDAPANTTIVECIARATPVLVNRIGAVTEYLGESYPFYYDTLAEASEKLADLDLIAKTVLYLRTWPVKKKITFHHFLQSLQNTTVYRMLPTPQSQQTTFKSYDLTLTVCSYRRLPNVKIILERLTQQEGGLRFEVIIWNNNFEAADELQSIVEEFSQRLDIKVIHSTENFFCIVRFAMLPLMRSPLLMICDDDVEPSSCYLKTFVDKYRQYGPDAVLCARGNVFLPHEVSDEEPERMWATGNGLEFYNEYTQDRRVHFMHADNCLIPRHILRRIAQCEMERYEFALVDDYWCSFVLAHQLQIPIWKIKADQAFRFFESAHDPEVALYLSEPVNQERVNFYIYHMQRGWPNAQELRAAESSKKASS